VADCGDYRRAAGEHRPAQPLVVEGDEVLDVPTAAGDDDDVDERVSVEAGERVDDFERRAEALYGGGAGDDACGREAVAQRLGDILEAMGVLGGDDADCAREARQPWAALRVAQPLPSEPSEQLLPAAEKLALTRELDVGDDDAEPACLRPEIRPVDLDLDEVALARLVLHPGELGTERLAGELRCDVGEVEHEHAAGRALLRLDLSLDDAAPDVAQRPGDAGGVLGDGQRG